jgi:hypothetical protein
MFERCLEGILPVLDALADEAKTAMQQALFKILHSTQDKAAHRALLYAIVSIEQRMGP